MLANPDLNPLTSSMANVIPGKMQQNLEYLHENLSPIGWKPSYPFLSHGGVKKLELQPG